jgi:hypothetical protein
MARDFDARNPTLRAETAALLGVEASPKVTEK